MIASIEQMPGYNISISTIVSCTTKNTNLWLINILKDTYNNLGQEALAFEAIALSVHDEADELDVVKEIFSDIPLRWTWAHHLAHREQVLIPFDWFYAINEFNGPSAGNCVEEALLQGICEVVERHDSCCFR